MAKIEYEELKSMVCDVISDNQDSVHISDDREVMLYTIAFNDGVLCLLEEIVEKYYPEKYYPEKCIKKFDPEEADSDKG